MLLVYILISPENRRLSGVQTETYKPFDLCLGISDGKKQKTYLRNYELLLNTIFCTILVFWLLEYRLITDIMLKSKEKELVFNFSFIQNLRIWLLLDKMSRFATECACLPNAPMHHLHSSLNYLLCSVTYNGRPSI